MRSLALIFFLAVALSLQAQRNARQRSMQHFSGVLELGTGWGHIIDFTLGNNNFTSKYPLQRLFTLPWQGGILISRSLNALSYLEYGMLYHRRSSDWIYSSVSAHTGTSIYGNRVTTYGTGTSHEVLTLDCLEFSFKYYKFLKYRKNWEIYAFGGITPVWVLNVAYASDLTNESVPRYLRKCLVPKPISAVGRV